MNNKIHEILEKLDQYDKLEIRIQKALKFCEDRDDLADDLIIPQVIELLDVRKTVQFNRMMLKRQLNIIKKSNQIRNKVELPIQ